MRFLQSQDPHRLQDPQRAECIAIRCVLRALKTHGHMALSAEVVDLIRLHLLNDPDQVGAVGEVAVVERRRGSALRTRIVRVLVKVIIGWY